MSQWTVTRCVALLRPGRAQNEAGGVSVHRPAAWNYCVTGRGAAARAGRGGGGGAAQENRFYRRGPRDGGAGGGGGGGDTLWMPGGRAARSRYFAVSLALRSGSPAPSSSRRFAGALALALRLRPPAARRVFRRPPRFVGQGRARALFGAPSPSPPPPVALPAPWPLRLVARSSPARSPRPRPPPPAPPFRSPLGPRRPYSGARRGDGGGGGGGPRLGRTGPSRRRRGLMFCNE